MSKVVIALIAVWLLTGGAGQVADDGRPAIAPAAINPYGGDAEAIENGEILFARISCHGCHGSNARGGNGPDLTDDEWLRQPGDDMVFRAIKFGRKGTMMSPFKDDLSDEQIWYLVSYLGDLAERRKFEER
jgi:cytochrome c oxidase cbb3-type subunit 3